MTRVSGRGSWTSCFPPNPNPYLATEPKVSRNRVFHNPALMLSKLKYLCIQLLNDFITKTIAIKLNIYAAYCKLSKNKSTACEYPVLEN
ncbi:hypothetical protein, partial [Halobacillus sp. BBL2006]|uniref:hypothetical protein n=1 Tax=Halobacillus sp. BBL2006 TaxID=1543706 RepID=UPI000541E34C